MAAGEVSGDRQAAHLARALLHLDPHLKLFGSGGERMRDAGVDVKIMTSHMGCVGIEESMRYVRPLRSVMTDLRRIIRTESPDLAILVDNEGFNGLLANVLWREGIPFVYYFAPQVWLWGRWRARKIAAQARLIIPAFPEEAELYRLRGGRVDWIGHPLLDYVKPEANAEGIFRETGLDPARRTIALMPGSRAQEVERLAPPMFEAAALIRRRHPDIQLVLPLASAHLLPLLREILARYDFEDSVTLATTHVYTLISRSALLLVAAGTATLEGALLGVPMLVAYRFAPLTALLARLLVHTKFIAMPNILLKQKIVPEFVQDEVNAERLALEGLRILEDEAYANEIRRRLVSVRQALGSSGAIARSAGLILREACAERERVGAGII